MIKLCTFDNINENKVDVVYLIDSFILWHARLDHIGANSMKRMLKMWMILYNANDAYKFHACIESKM